MSLWRRKKSPHFKFVDRELLFDESEIQLTPLVIIQVSLQCKDELRGRDSRHERALPARPLKNMSCSNPLASLPPLQRLPLTYGREERSLATDTVLSQDRTVHGKK